MLTLFKYIVVEVVIVFLSATFYYFWNFWRKNIVHIVVALQYLAIAPLSYAPFATYFPLLIASMLLPEIILFHLIT